MRSVPLTSENLASYDVVLIATDHSCVDYESIASLASLVVDTRNAVTGKNHNKNVVRA
jgi:UDP-N-acetyl-D-glucosamine dehydrogenase